MSLLPPAAAAREPGAARLPAGTGLGDYVGWLATHRGLEFTSYEALWHWSVTDLAGFWSSIWDHFGIPGSYGPVLGRPVMPGAEWFPGTALNYAEQMVGRPEDTGRVAVVARSQTRPPATLTFGELRDQVARARAGLLRLGVGPGDRVAAYLPTIPETLIAFLATASLGAIWASCAPEFGARAVIDRFAQIEPAVLLAATGYDYGERSAASVVPASAGTGERPVRRPGRGGRCHSRPDSHPAAQPRKRALAAQLP